jgi:hypothetical protein
MDDRHQRRTQAFTTMQDWAYSLAHYRSYTLHKFSKFHPAICRTIPYISQYSIELLRIDMSLSPLGNCRDKNAEVWVKITDSLLVGRRQVVVCKQSLQTVGAELKRSTTIFVILSVVQQRLPECWLRSVLTHSWLGQSATSYHNTKARRSLVPKSSTLLVKDHVAETITSLVAILQQVLAARSIRRQRFNTVDGRRVGRVLIHYVEKT